MGKRKNKQPYDLVVIKWVDSGRSPNWELLEELTKPVLTVIFSVGWLVSKTKHALFIVPHLSDPNCGAAHQSCGGMTIPRAAVISQHVISKAN